MDINIKVKVSEHNTLNNAKGVVYTNEFRFLNDDEIITELKDQGVKAIRRIQRRYEDKLIDTGLYILTFNTTHLPKEIKIGYNIEEVKHYLPPPIRCFQCGKFGHTSKQCHKEKICINCGNEYHLTEDNPKCNEQQKCINCNEEHNSLSKQCTVYKKEFEINKIIITENISRNEAIIKYKQKNPEITYAQITKPNKCTCKCKCNEKLTKGSQETINTQQDENNTQNKPNNLTNTNTNLTTNTNKRNLNSETETTSTETTKVITPNKNLTTKTKKQYKKRKQNQKNLDIDNISISSVDMEQ